MKLSDYVMECIADLGIRDVFYLPGGAAMHLNDSLGANKRLRPVCMLHEQACAIAAEAYARVSGGYGVCLVTSGPGSTNALTGLAGAYLDAVPVLFLSGQVKRADRVNGQNIRQFGIQEIDTVSLVRPLTKYAVEIETAASIRCELEKAAAIARHGKPGPVWISIPLDVQAAEIEPEALPGFADTLRSFPCAASDIAKTITLFNAAERPALLLGHGIRLSGATKLVEPLCEALGVPVLTTWNGADLIADDHPLFFGRPGAVGHRCANFVQQNADFVLSIGARLNLLSTGFDFTSFLAKAKHVMVEIDAGELQKRSVRPALAVQADAGDFMRALLRSLPRVEARDRSAWLAHCSAWKRDYPRFLPEQSPRPGFVSTYRLIDEIARQLTGGDIYQFSSSGTTTDIAMQAFRVKRGQRAFLNKGLAAMGYDLPSCIGCAIASGGRRVVCVTGDGGFLMNVQELATLARLQLPVKLFIADNRGYGMIYNSQSGNFRRLAGCTEASGLHLPDLRRVAEAFGIRSFGIENEAALPETVAAILACEGPALCAVKADIAQKILPRQTNYMRPDGQMGSRPLEDMTPLLPRDEFAANCL